MLLFKLILALSTAYFTINKVLLSFQESSSWKRKRPAMHLLFGQGFFRSTSCFDQHVNTRSKGFGWRALFLVFGARNSPRPHGVETVKRVLSNFDSKNLGAGEACLLVCLTSFPGAPVVHTLPQSKNRHSVDNLDKA